MSKKRGMFLAVEGSDGAGKTTQLNNIANAFRERGYEVIVTREPGGTEMAEEIREVVLAKRNEPVHPKTELALFYGARIQHIENLIKPAVEAGKIVICDRFVDSTYAYQVYGKGLSDDDFNIINEWAIGDYTPDITFLFIVEASVGLERVKQRLAVDHIDVERIEFFNRVNKGYLAAFNHSRARYLMIDANKTFEEVSTEINDAVDRIISLR